jgi:hypothetical protein
MRPEDSLLFRLAQLDIAPQDIDYVVIRGHGLPPFQGQPQHLDDYRLRVLPPLFAGALEAELAFCARHVRGYMARNEACKPTLDRSEAVFLPSATPWNRSDAEPPARASSVPAKCGDQLGLAH